MYANRAKQTYQSGRSFLSPTTLLNASSAKPPTYRMQGATPRSFSSSSSQEKGDEDEGYMQKLARGFGYIPPHLQATRTRLAEGTTHYRMDTRSPSEIMEVGFKRKVQAKEPITTGQLQEYQRNNAANPGVISLARTEADAESFARDRGKIFPGPINKYRINMSGKDVLPIKGNIPWYQSMRYSNQGEAITDNDIAPEDIEHMGEEEYRNEDETGDFKD